MSTKPSQFIWYDLMTTDVKAAEKFYADVVGWQISDSGLTHQAYSILKSRDIMVGGMMTIPEDAAKMGAKPAWMGHIYVDDVDAYAKKIKAAGGSIYRDATDIPTIGRFAVAGDPTGAGFIIFKPSGSESAAPLPDGTPGTIGWRELHSGNWEQAWDFYAKLFHWTKDETMDMGPMGKYQLFKAGGEFAYGGMMNKHEGSPMAHWAYYFYVDGVAKAAAKITKHGGKITNGPMEVPGGQWSLNAMDPLGAHFNLLSKVK